MVAIHSGGSTIPVGTVSRIIKDAGWSDNDLKRLKLMK
jgi:predicted RNA binding protein YcfA (HicA-like mRNA interferase family)